MIAITPPKERQVDASALPTLIDDFIKTKRRQIAASSADGYMQDLAPFLAWWQHRQNPLLDDDSFGEMVQWIEAHYRNGFGQPPSAQMLWRTTKRVRQLLTWAHDKGYIPVSLTDMCPLYPDPGRDKYFPDADDLAAMIAACNGDTRLRDVALILFATATGARRFLLRRPGHGRGVTSCQGYVFWGDSHHGALLIHPAHHTAYKVAHVLPVGIRKRSQRLKFLIRHTHL